MTSPFSRLGRYANAAALLLLVRSITFAEAVSFPEMKTFFSPAEAPDAALDVSYLARVPPAILTALPSVSSPAGHSVRFSMEIRGSAPLNVQWLKNGIKIPGATFATLVIPNVREADAGRYHAIVTNVAGSTLTNLATLTVTKAVAAPSKAKVAFRVD